MAFVSDVTQNMNLAGLCPRNVCSHALTHAQRKKERGAAGGAAEQTRTLYCIKHLGCMYKGGVNSLTVVVTFHLEKVKGVHW